MLCNMNLLSFTLKISPYEKIHNIDSFILKYIHIHKRKTYNTGALLNIEAW